MPALGVARAAHRIRNKPTSRSAAVTEHFRNLTVRRHLTSWYLQHDFTDTFAERPPQWATLGGLEHPSGEEVVLAALIHNAQVPVPGGVDIRHGAVNLVQFQ